MENYNDIKTMKEEKRTEFKTYYERPTQVMFYEADPNTWSWGIAYREEIENSIHYCAEEISEREYLIAIGELDEDE